MNQFGVRLRDKIIREGFSEAQAKDFVRVKVENGGVGYFVVKRKVSEWEDLK